MPGLLTYTRICHLPPSEFMNEWPGGSVENISKRIRNRKDKTSKRQTLRGQPARRLLNWFDGLWRGGAFIKVVLLERPGHAFQNTTMSAFMVNGVFNLHP